MQSVLDVRDDGIYAKGDDYSEDYGSVGGVLGV